MDISSRNDKVTIKLNVTVVAEDADPKTRPIGLQLHDQSGMSGAHTGQKGTDPFFAKAAKKSVSPLLLCFRIAGEKCVWTFCCLSLELCEIEDT